MSSNEWRSRKADRIAVYTLVSILVLMISIMVGTLLYGVLIGFGYIVYNREGKSVPAALDLRSCEVLAMQESETPPDDIGARFADAVHHGRIIQLANGTDVTEGDLLTVEDRHLIPWAPPKTTPRPRELLKQIAICEWVTPKGASHQGSVCVRANMVQPKYPPM